MSAVKVALIGVGRRGRAVYLPVLEAIKDELELVALCDRQRESAGEAAEQARVPAFHSVRDLVAAGAAQAAIVCTPVESHHAISVFLSRHGIHHVVETGRVQDLLKHTGPHPNCDRDLGEHQEN